MSASLPRQAFLGIELAADAFGDAGMRAAGVIPGSMADAAGVVPGDLVESLGGVRLDSLDALQDAARKAGALAIVKAIVVHEGARVERSMLVQRRPLETNVIYDCIDVGGIRLRTLVTKPEKTPAPAVLFVQGLSRESIDFASANVAPFRELVQAWTREGFATMRVEKRGVGDSEGTAADFQTEVADVQRALDALRAMDFVSRVFVFGHSVGGMIAPLLHSPSGLIVYGTSSARWYDCIEASRTRQRALRKMSKVTGPVPRTSYENGIHAVDLAEAWSKVDSPVLVLHGEHDWVVGEDEARAIPARHAEFQVIPHLDHLLTAHDDVEKSLAAYGTGRLDSAIAAITSAWMRRMIPSPNDPVPGVQSPRSS